MAECPPSGNSRAKGVREILTQWIPFGKARSVGDGTLPGRTLISLIRRPDSEWTDREYSWPTAISGNRIMSPVNMKVRATARAGAGFLPGIADGFPWPAPKVIAVELALMVLAEWFPAAVWVANENPLKGFPDRSMT